MKKESSREITDGYMKSLEGMNEASTRPFFYSRLKAKMEEKNEISAASFKPGWAIASLLLFLFLNSWIISHQRITTGEQKENKTGLKEFADSYNLNSESNY